MLAHRFVLGTYFAIKIYLIMKLPSVPCPCLFACLLTAPYQAPHIVLKMLALKDIVVFPVQVPRGPVWLNSSVQLKGYLRLGMVGS